MDEATARPLPRFPEPDTQYFWSATKDHRLVYQVCESCAGVVFYPRRHCPHCVGGELSYRDSDGRGRLYTFTTIRRTGVPFFAARVPYVVGFVDLDEGFRILTEIVDVDPATLEVGALVEVAWEDYDDLSLPIFHVSTDR